MAAIDFPASPVDNQLFAAANGVTYQWNATPGLWRAVTTSTGTQANFYAATTTSVGTSPVTPTNFAVMTGNEGGWFTPANGRFTPPAGRYRISSGFASGALAGQATNMATYLRKNGTIIASPTVTTALAGYFGEAYAEYIVDANGTDWFDAQYVSAQGITTSAAQIWFCAIPVGAIVPIPRQVDLTHLPGSITVYGAGHAVSGSLLPVLFGTIVTGNESGWYNVSNGRYTPPAGRYLLTYSLCCSVTAAGHINGYFYKNNAQIGALTSQYISAAGGNGTVSSSVEVDANGTDFFDVRLNAGVAGMLAQGSFSAAPVGVVEAMPAPGDGTLRLYSEQVLAAPASEIRVNVPAAAKRVELQYDLQLATLTPDVDLYFHVLQGGTIYTTANMAQQMLYGQGTTAAAARQVSQGFWSLFIGVSWSGMVTLSLSPSARSDMFMSVQGNRISTTTHNVSIQYFDGGPARSTVTGFRFATQSGANFAVNSTVRAYVVT